MSKFTVLFCLAITAFLVNAENSCPENEVFQTCGPPLWCFLSCEFVPGLRFTCPPGCEDGCVCRNGFVRENSQPGAKCIPMGECHNRNCPSGEIFHSCGSSCPETCANMNNRPTCPPICVEGCFCPAGTVRDEVNNVCVRPENCQFCPNGELFHLCGSSCPETCANMNNRPTCPPICVEGCICPEGTVRDEVNNVCVRRENCPLIDN